MVQRVLVYSNTDPIEPRMILELLFNNGIEARLVGPDAALFGAGQVIVEQQITVPHEQVDAARELIDAFHSDDVEFVEQGHDREEHENWVEEKPVPHRPLAADDAAPVWPPFIALTSVHAVLFWSTRGDQQRAMEIGALEGWPPAGELYRLVTSGFLHADLGHLLVNSANLLVVIWIVLQFLSLGRATFVYATSNLTAGVAAALVDSSIGSSGGIFALVFAAFAIRIRHPRASASRRSGRGPLNAGVALLMLPMLAFGSIAGHVAGAVTGFALGWWLAQKEPDPSPGNRRAPWWLGWFGVLLLFGPWVWRLLAG